MFLVGFSTIEDLDRAYHPRFNETQMFLGTRTVETTGDLPGFVRRTCYVDLQALDYTNQTLYYCRWPVWVTDYDKVRKTVVRTDGLTMDDLHERRADYYNAVLARLQELGYTPLEGHVSFPEGYRLALSEAFTLPAGQEERREVA